MKKLIFTAAVLLMSSLAFAQSFEMPKAFQTRLANLQKAAGKAQLREVSQSLGKSSVKMVERGATIEWNDSTNAWNTDTSQFITYSWNTNGSPISTTTDMFYDGQHIRMKSSNFKPVNGDMMADPHLIGYFPALIESQIQMAGTWVTVFKMESEFDATSGHLIRTTSSQFNIVNWVPMSKSEYNYDTQGSYTGEETYSYDNGSWELSYGDRATYTYNGNDITTVVQEEYLTDTAGNSSWEMINKEEYTAWNTDGSIKSGIRYAYDVNSTSWVPTNKADNVTWHNFIAKPAYGDDNMFAIGGSEYSSIELYTYTGSTWNLDQKITKTYTNDKPVSQVTQFDMGGNWLDESKTEWMYYSNGDLKSRIASYWDGTAWVESEYETYTNTYDTDGDLTLSETDYGYSGSSYYKVKNAYTYSIQTSIANSASKVNVTAYPNPVQNQLNISMGEQTAATISIADMTGREVLRSNYTNISGAIRVDASVLPAGTYVLTVTTASERYTQPIIKR